MKTVVIAALALLLGLFVGGLAPRRELAQAQRDLEQARAEATSSDPPSVLPGALGGLLGAGAAPEKQGPPRFVVRPQEPPVANDQPDAGAGQRRRRGHPFKDDEAFGAAKAALDFRAAQLRAAFLEEARLDAAGKRALDETVRAFNAEVARAADELTTTLAGQPDRKLGMREMADVMARMTDVYRKADDQLKAALPETARAAMEKTGFDLVTQIDLTGVRKLAEVVETRGVRPPAEPSP